MVRILRNESAFHLRNRVGNGMEMGESSLAPIFLRKDGASQKIHTSFERAESYQNPSEI